MAKKQKQKEESKSNTEQKGYDNDLDRCIKDLGTVAGAGGRGGDFSVRIMAYNGGENKISISRTGTNTKTGQQWFSPKLGRITAKEYDALLPLLAKARKILDKKASRKSEED